MKVSAGVTVPSGIWSALVITACAGLNSVPPVMGPGAANAVVMVLKHKTNASARVKNALRVLLFLFMLILLIIIFLFAI